MTTRLSLLPTLAAAACLGLAAALPVAPALAQSPFAVAARVNNDIVTNYEIQQRRLFLSLLNAPGDVLAAVPETLVNERLQNQAAERLGAPGEFREARLDGVRPRRHAEALGR
ncbi:MAG: hypothetical protein ACTS11_14120, partial [Roseicyclus sp.]